MVLNISSRPLFICVFCLMVVNAIWLLATPTRLDFEQMAPWAVITVVLASGFYICRRIGHRQTHPDHSVHVVGNLFEGLLFLQISWFTLRVLNHLTMTTALPMADGLLISWDQKFGLNWIQYFEWVHSQPLVIRILDLSYTSLTFLSILALTGLVVMCQAQRARYFIETFFVTAVFCILAGMFFPAEAAVVVLVPDLSAYPNFTTPPGVYHIDHLTALRDPHIPAVLNPENLPGLVTFPSFHTAGGILLAVAYWRTAVFIPVSLYSLIMIASTPVSGGHYIIDLIAGAAVAGVVATLIARRTCYAGLFAPAPLVAEAPKKTPAAAGMSPVSPTHR